ncbi:MAG: hypothetical protein KIG68_09480 [Oxalobacter sp.]|nr:hypothetical protein [Oxalobacter sp.]
MQEISLVQAIARFLEQVCSQYQLPNKRGELVVPKIFTNYLPPKRTGNDDDFPFIIVRPVSGSTSEATVTDVSLIVGIYDKDLTGFERALEVVTKIRTALLSIPTQVLEKRYQLRLPIEWHNVDEQAWPQWQLNITTHWLTFSPKPWTDGTDYGL